MESIKFIIGLRRSYEAYRAEVEYAKTTMLSEYFRFLKSFEFFGLIEQVVTACAMFPRSIQSCQDNLTDLSFGIYNELGIGKFYLTDHNQERFSRLILETGQEVINQLTAHRYYFEPHQLPREMDDDPHFCTDLAAISDVTQINPFTFNVEIYEERFETLDALPQNAISLPRLTKRSY